MKKLWILTLLLFFVFAGCGDSDNSTGPVDADQLVGTWTATEYLYTSDNNASLTEDVLVTLGMSVTFKIEANGNFTITVTVQGQSVSSTGNINEGSNGEINVSDANTTATLANNKLTLVTKNVTWDFGNGNEPATLRQVYGRS